jgi:hypothetical protein
MTYRIPQIHRATLMKVINRLVSIRVIKRQSLLDWASPAFIIPKTDKTVQTISDFRELNMGSQKTLLDSPKPTSHCRS